MFACWRLSDRIWVLVLKNCDFCCDFLLNTEMCCIMIQLYCIRMEDNVLQCIMTDFCSLKTSVTFYNGWGRKSFAWCRVMTDNQSPQSREKTEVVFHILARCAKYLDNCWGMDIKFVRPGILLYQILFQWDFTVNLINIVTDPWCMIDNLQFQPRHMLLHNQVHHFFLKDIFFSNTWDTYSFLLIVVDYSWSAKWE